MDGECYAWGYGRSNGSKPLQPLPLPRMPLSSPLHDDDLPTRCSSESSDTALNNDHAARIVRAGSVTSTARPGPGAAASLPHLGGNHLLRSNSAGSKRSYDVTDEEDDTPTKRAKELEESLCVDEGNAWTWGRSPPGHRSRTRFGSDRAVNSAADCSKDLSCERPERPASGACADLCCGESDVFAERHNNRAALAPLATGVPIAAQPRRRLALSSGCPHLQTASEPAFEVDPYLWEMIGHLYKSENDPDIRASPDYLDRHGCHLQPRLFIDDSMRMIAVSWLVEVACEYRLHQETLFLATALLDRFLSNSKAVPRSNLQLIAVACMLIAAKHEEEVYPSISDFTNIADNCFQSYDLLRMEALVLDSLSFRINMPTAHTFLQLFWQALHPTRACKSWSAYFAELATLEYGMLQYQPSEIAAAAILLAQQHEVVPNSPEPLARVAKRRPAQLRACAEDLLELHHRAWAAKDVNSPYMAVKDKFCAFEPWYNVGCIEPLAAVPACATPQ